MGSGDITKELSDDQFARILSELAELRGMMNGFGNKIASLETRVGALEAKVDALDDKVENRLKETRPLWEVVIARLDGLQEDVQKGFRKMSVFADDIIQVRADQRHLEDRLDKIEKLQHQ